MVLEIEVMQIKEGSFTKTFFHLRSDKGDLKGFQTIFKHYFYKYMSQTDTCPFESA